MERDAQRRPARGGQIDRLDSLAYLLDNSIPIPGTGRRIGVDAVLGLVPGVGDVAGSAMSAYIVVQAARLGAPPSVIGRMVANVAIETMVGTIPLLGDLFDAGWKANARNMRLLRASAAAPTATRRSSRAVVVGALVALLLLFAVAGVVAVAVGVAFWRWLTRGGPGLW